MRNSGFACVLTASISLIAAGPAQAHRAYNVTGYSTLTDLNGDTVMDLADGTIFSTNGSDGLWTGHPGQPANSTFVMGGGSGPNCGTPAICAAGTSSSSSYYNGALPVSWNAFVHAFDFTPGDVYDLNRDDALAIGTTTPSNFSLAVSGNSTGTGMDFGYLRIDRPNWMRITVSADTTLGSTLQPFVSLYGGWDNSWSGADGAVRDTTGASIADRTTAFVPGDNPFGSTDLIAYFLDANAGGASAVTLMFLAPAASHYTLLIGGANDSAGAYRAIVETVAAPVPVPAAVWLLGSALGAMGFSLRRTRRSRT